MLSLPSLVVRFLQHSSVLAKEVAFKEEWIKFSKAHSYIELRLFFTHMKQSYSVKGFGDMSVDDEPPRLYRRLICLSQAAMPDRVKLS